VQIFWHVKGFDISPERHAIAIASDTANVQFMDCMVSNRM